MKAAIQGSGSTHRRAAPAAKVSNAQEAGFAKSGLRGHAEMRDRPLTEHLERHENATGPTFGMNGIETGLPRLLPNICR